MKLNNGGVLKDGFNFILDSVEIARNNKVKEIEENGYNQGVELGIYNTIFALYSANITDKDIIRITRDIWKIEESEIEDILVDTKQSFILREIRKYLKLQGQTENNIRSFFNKNKVIIKIKQNPEILRFKNNPEKLVKFLEN